MKDINTGEIVEVDEDKDNKAFMKVFRILNKRILIDRDIKIISKDLI